MGGTRIPTARRDTLVPRSAATDRGRSRLALLAVACGALLSGCPATTQVIRAVNNGGSITTSGNGFSNIPQCAQVALLGLPPPQAAISMGMPSCSGGSFTNFSWRFSLATAPGSLQNCAVTGQQNVVVSATDQGNSGVATQNLSMGWGPNCTIICGTLGQPACPAGCLEGVNSNPGQPNGTCVQCGGEGNPPCPGNTCQPGLHVNGPVCTASCGNVNQPPCETDGSALGVTSIFHCYSGSTFGPNGCVCVFDPNSNPCQEINSGGTGVCVGAVLIPQGCR